jgi:16S rRNA (guanine966-N2)-methyltransferase
MSKSLRIIAGTHRGRTLERPPSTITRPTMDKVRESIFNMLMHGDFPVDHHPVVDATVLDAFAGSGALGLEALSRGAAFTYFFDKSPRAHTIIKKNILALKEQDNSKLMIADATRPLKPPSPPPSLVLLDPPFYKDLASKALKSLTTNGWITPGCIIVAEVEAGAGIKYTNDFKLLREKNYGTADVFILIYLGDEQNAV